MLGRPKTLKARLVLAFVSVSVISAGAVGAAVYVSFRDALVTNAEQQSVDDVRSRIGVLTPDLHYQSEAHFQPDQQELDRFRSALGGAALVTYGSVVSADAGIADVVSADLRGAVAAGNDLVYQRVNSATGPTLVIGTPIMLTALDGSRTPSGIDVYVVRDLASTVRTLDSAVRTAATAALLTLAAAVLLALLSVRGVLRPVRHLRDTARQLADGDLGARSRMPGADELAELAGTFNDMARALQHSVAELQQREANSRRFVADVSHELRTPLTTLNMVVHVLQSSVEGMGEVERESTLLTVDEVDRLTQLVTDLIEVSRFDAGTARANLEEVDPRRIIEDCLDLRHWRDRVDLTGPSGTVAVLDRRRIDVLVANLVSNALRHGQPPVRVMLTVDESTVRIEVTDHGPGLPESAIAQVFDRFYKHDTARARSEGSGLGLAIALEIARLHDGDITAANSPDGGARFVATLPRFPRRIG